MNTDFYVLDNHKRILCVETAIEAALDLLQGLPKGYEIVDDDDKPITLDTLIH